MRRAIRPDSIQPWKVDFDDASGRYEIRNHAPGHDPRIIATGIRFERDAFFIAHAANVHDELVKALRKVNRLVSEGNGEFDARQKVRAIAAGMLEELGEKP